MHWLNLLCKAHTRCSYWRIAPLSLSLFGLSVHFSLLLGADCSRLLSFTVPHFAHKGLNQNTTEPLCILSKLAKWAPKRIFTVLQKMVSLISQIFGSVFDGNVCSSDSTGNPKKKHRSETQQVDEDECPSAETDAAVDEQTPPTTTVSSVDMCYYCFDVLKARLYNQPAPSAPTFTNEPL